MNIHIILIIILSAIRLGRSDDIGKCQMLENKYLKRGFITDKERDQYCQNGCQFLKMSCHRQIPAEYRLVRDVTAAINGILKGEYVEKLTANEPMFQDEVTDLWKSAFLRTWPMLLCLVPIAANQWKYYNFWGAMFLTLVMVSLLFAINMPKAILIHNLVTCWLAYVSPASSSAFLEAIWPTAFVLALIAASFLADSIIQISVLVMVLLFYVLYIKTCFFSRKGSSNASFVLCFTQLWVVMDQMSFIRSNYALNSFGGALVEMMLNSFVPTGQSKYWFLNVLTLAKQVVNTFPYETVHKIAFFIALVLLQSVMFVAFRSCLGAYYLYVLRYKYDAQTIATGFLVYTADFFGPFECLFRIAFRLENWNYRRVTYACLGLVLSWFELYGSYEFFMFRLVASLTDKILIHSVYGRTTHYLGCNVDFGLAAFPHDGAFVWTSINELMKIAKYVGTLEASRGQKCVKGMGAVLRSGGKVMLYTVRHVVDGANMIQLLNYTVSSPIFENLTNTKDPMVCMKLQDEIDAPDCDLLTVDETEFVSQLVFINTSGGENFVCFVPDFKVKNGKLQARVNLKHGDSGGPCFAVLNDGCLRLCGVVSEGRPKDGGGNIISFCYHAGKLQIDSSDDENQSLSEVTQFNAVRRKMPQNPCGEGYRRKRYMQVSKILRDLRDDFVTISKWRVKPSHTEMDDDVTVILKRIAPELYGEDDGDPGKTKLEKPRKPDEEEDEEPPIEWQKKPKARVKSDKKERAARKRAILAAKLLWTSLEDAYEESDAISLFTLVMQDKLRSLWPRIAVEDSGRHVTFADDNTPNPGVLYLTAGPNGAVYSMDPPDEGTLPWD